MTDKADNVHPIIEAMAKALDEAQFWTRFNDFTADCVEGYPIEVCRYGREGEDEIVVVARFPSGYGENIALAEVSRIERAKAAAKVLLEMLPTEGMCIPGGLAIEAAMFEEGKLVFDGAADCYRAMTAAARSEMGV